MASGSDAELLMKLVGADREALRAKRESEIVARNPDAFASGGPLLAGIGARMAQSGAENAELPRRQAEQGALRSTLDAPPTIDTGQNPAIQRGLEALVMLGAIPANVAQAGADPGTLLALARDLNPFNTEQPLAPGNRDALAQFDPSLTGEDVTGNPVTGLLFDLVAPGVDAAMLPWGRAARGNQNAQDVLQRSLARASGEKTLDSLVADIGAITGSDTSGFFRHIDGTRVQFGPDTYMEIVPDRLPDGRESLGIDKLFTANPNSLRQAGLKLTPEQRQLVTILDLADSNGIPVTTVAGAFEHQSLATAELKHMYNRLGFAPDPKDPSLLIREPLPMDWLDRQAELRNRHIPAFRDRAELIGDVKRRFVNGDPPTMSELIDPNDSFAIANFHAGNLVRRFRRTFGDITPDEIDALTKELGKGFHYQMDESSLKQAIFDLAQRFRISTSEAEDMLGDYAMMMDF